MGVGDADRRPSAVPRIPFEEFPTALASSLAPRVQRLGYLGEFFQCAAHQPDALLAFHLFTETAKEALGERLAEVVALTVSVETRNDYERNQHERLSIRRGHDRAWIAAVEQLGPDENGPLDDQERLAQTVALSLVRHGGDSARAVEAYAARQGAPATIALLLVAARYIAHAAIVKALAIDPPVPSIFEDGFDGD